MGLSSVNPERGKHTVEKLAGRLDLSRYVNHPLGMSAIKISSKVEKEVWESLREVAAESHQNVSGLLTEAIREYVQRRRIRPVVLKHLDDSIAENFELGERLAR